MRGVSLVIRAAPALSSVVSGGGIRRGWHAISAAVAHPSIHALPAFLAPAMLSIVTQICSLPS